MNNIWRSMGNVSKRTKVALMLFLAVAAMGCTEKEENSADEVKTEKVREIKRKPAIEDFKIDPTVSNAEWKKQLDAIHPYVLAETVFSEGFADEMYSDKGFNSGCWTIGSGYMLGAVNPTRDKARQMIKERREFFKKVLGRWPEGTKITPAENQKLMTAVYNSWVYPQMRKAFTKKISAHLFIELAIAAYNRGQGIYQNKTGAPIANSVNNGNSDEQIVNKFNSLLKNGNGGLAPKYGIAGHRVLGNISDADVLNAHANAVYRLSDVKLWDNKKQLKKQYADTIADIIKSIDDTDFTNYIWAVDKKGRRLKKKRTFKQNAVKEYLTPAQVQTILSGELFATNTIDDILKQADKKTNVEKTQVSEKKQQFEAVDAVQYNSATAGYKSGNYADAARQFEMLVKKYPQNAALRNDLAATYNKLGRYDDAIAQCNAVIKDTGDASQLGAAYFNAGVAREKKGDVESALTNYKLAVKNGNAAAKKSVDRLTRENKSSQGNTKAKGFKAGAKKVSQNKESDKSLAQYIIGKTGGYKK